jgi:hypothetical protein
MKRIRVSPLLLAEPVIAPGCGGNDAAKNGWCAPEPGKGRDTYRIRLDTGYGSRQHKLAGGNVQIH